MELIFSVLFLLFTLIVGKALEKSHLKSLDDREKQFSNITVLTSRTLPPGTRVESSAVCIGHIVVSPSYWRRFQAGWKTIFGGEIKGVRMALDRGRREALIRMMRHAASMGCDLVINTRMSTSIVGSAAGDKGLTTIEIMAYGTAIRRTPGA